MYEPDITPPLPGRYTPDGDAAVEARIARDQALIGEAVTKLLVPPTFRALVLTGGYGRGEGGYMFRDGQPVPYNGYDYFVVVHGMGRPERNQVQAVLEQAAHDLEPAVGVEVYFALLRDEFLPTADYSLIHAETLWGHRVVAGDPQVLAPMPVMPFGTLPHTEFTRLLLNRGSLLLLNQQRLNAGEAIVGDGHEAFFKHLFKAVLACGDARLAGNRRYHPSYLIKRDRLEQVNPTWAGQEELLDLYRQAMENKFHPDYGRFEQDGADLDAWQARVVGVWLETLAWFEGVRTGTPVTDWDTYASPRLDKGQSRDAGNLPANLARNLLDFGMTAVLLNPVWAGRYPRDRLASALPLLLAAPGAPVSAPLAAALGLSRGVAWSVASNRFRNLWARYA